MEIWGDGETVRDFLYIDDMARALNLLIEMPFDNDVYNIASGTGLSLNEVINIVEKVCKKKLNVRYRKKRRSDVNSIALDSSRFIRKTGWRPEMTLEKGILLTWQWIQRQ
jgi:UDP-glucose 4-epimerase